jgi:hypothetical protein
MSDPDLHILTALRRLRRLETDAARRDLGRAISVEVDLSTRQAALEGELDDARATPGEFDREVFAAWYARMTEARTRLAAEARDAEARTGVARTALANRRVAETAAEDALAREVAARDAIEARRDQAMLEDAARALKQAADEGQTPRRRSG